MEAGGRRSTCSIALRLAGLAERSHTVKDCLDQLLGRVVQQLPPLVAPLSARRASARNIAP
jgi:hypothetical protein